MTVLNLTQLNPFERQFQVADNKKQMVSVPLDANSLVLWEEVLWQDQDTENLFHSPHVERR
jgi:hypothetical protein